MAETLMPISLAGAEAVVMLPVELAVMLAFRLPGAGAV